MKCTIPEISWHNREPVLCVDIQPSENEFYRLATGGSDCHVVIWHTKILENGCVTVNMVSDLARHQRAVNAVRWSPNGEYLASADDDANIIIWNLKIDNIPPLDDDNNDTEIWIVTKVLRGHKEDIYDICWSPNSLKLLSGSIDNSAIIWDFAKGKMETILSDHKAFVQGVAWDPKGQFIATLSSERLCRIYENNGKQVRARIGKGFLPVPKSHLLYNKEVKYFHDDTFKSYFRRIQFSPDGNLLIAPSGTVETEDSKRALYGTYIFTMDSLMQPSVVLPLTKQCSIAVRCCPVLFNLRVNGPDPVIKLPYRMIFAVATDNDVILYDTQQIAPFAHFQRIHYTRLTDLSWSPDGLLLIACSTDGFCTLITFEANELGVAYDKQESNAEDNALNISGYEEPFKEESKCGILNLSDIKSRKSNFLEQWANTVQSKNNTSFNDKEINNKNKQREKSKRKVTENIDITSPDRTCVQRNEHDKYNTASTYLLKNEEAINSITNLITVCRKSKSLNDTSNEILKPNKLPKKSQSDINKPTYSKQNVLESIKTVGDESVARDTWNSEQKLDEKIVTKEADNSIDVPDFKLQLEVSTPYGSNSVSKECSIENITILEDSKDVKYRKTEFKGILDREKDLLNFNSNPDSCIKNEILHTNIYSEKHDRLIVNKNKVESKNIKTMQNLDQQVIKSPRRVPLITLSSPKNKKQKTNT